MRQPTYTHQQCNN